MAIAGGVAIPRRNVSLPGVTRVGDPSERLQRIHQNEMGLIVPRILRLVQAGHEGSDLERYTERYRSSIGIHRAEVIYDFVDKMATYSGGEFRWEGVYVPFLLKGEYFVAQYFPERIRGPLSHVLLQDRDILLRVREDAMVFEYLQGEDFEDFRSFVLQRSFDDDAPLVGEDRCNQTFTVGFPEFRVSIVTSLASRIGTGKRVLSVGCGSGELETDLIGSGQRVVGIDFSPKMAEVALGDAHELTKLVSGQFDVVIFPESIGYLWEDHVLREAYKVLVPGGRVVIITYALAHKAAGYRRRPMEEMKKVIEGAGFQILMANSFVIAQELHARGEMMMSRNIPLTERDTDNIQTITAQKPGDVSV